MKAEISQKTSKIVTKPPEARKVALNRFHLIALRRNQP